MIGNRKKSREKNSFDIDNNDFLLSSKIGGWVYILKSKKYKWFYVGITNNLINRFKLHNSGKIESTKKLKPFILIYYEAHNNRYDAAKRETNVIGSTLYKSGKK